MSKERFQNPNCGDELKLRLFAFNSNFKKNVYSIDKVEIYFYDPNEISQENPDGIRLVETINSTNISNDNVGEYGLTLNLSEPLYTIGKYKDKWYIKFEENEQCSVATVDNNFEVYPDLWFTAPGPSIYDFSFYFKPNKITKGSKRYILIEVVPNVPKGNDIERYYNNLAVISEMKIYIEKNCSDCLPQEKDLRMVVDGKTVSFREKRFGYYFIDTSDMDEGIYDIWFELSYAENVFVSDKGQLQIY